jgi:hypothetical protein
MAAYQDIFIDEGTDFVETFCLDRVPSLNLVDYSIRGELRKCLSSEDSLEFTFSTNVDINKFYAQLTNAQTETLEEGRYHYDIEFVNNTTSTITKAFWGTAHVTPQVTRI